MTTHHLLAVWPVYGDRYSRDELIEKALPHLDAVAAQARAIITGPSTWRLIDADDLEGWEHHDGQLLVATMPAKPADIAELLTERYGDPAALEAERAPEPAVDLARWCADRAEAHADYEAHEWPAYRDRDTALVEWTVRVLGRPYLPESRAVLAALAARHGLQLVTAA